MVEIEESNGKWLQRILLSFAAALILGGVGVAIWSYNATAGSSDWASPGIRGDFFGGHFAAVSGLVGVLLMLVAVLMQRQELQMQRSEMRLQREEMGLQRSEMKHTREAAEQQAKALEAQTKELKTQNRMTWQRDDMHALNTMIQIAVSYETAVVGHDRVGITYPHRKRVQEVGLAALQFIFRRAATDEQWGYTLLHHYWSTFPFGKDFAVDKAIKYSWDGVEEPAKRALRETEWEGVVRAGLRGAVDS